MTTMNILTAAFAPEKFFNALCCEFSGDPETVRDALEYLCNKWWFLKPRLAPFLAETKEYIGNQKKQYLDDVRDREERLANSDDGGCIDCLFGNGEGGCTIPGYCPSANY